MAQKRGLHLESINGLIVDLDGVLWRGDIALPGAAEFIQLLEARSLPYVVATNDPSPKPEQLAGWLGGMGILVRPERVLTAGMVVVDALRQRHPPGAGVLVIGVDSLKELVQQAGFRLAGERADALVVTLAADVRLHELNQAIRALSRGADFVAPNREMTYPMERDIGAGDGVLVAALEAATQRRARVMGKPRPVFFRTALKMLGLPAGSVLVVGDSLGSDIAGGRRVGAPTALVLTGITDRAQLARGPVKPDWVFQDLPELTRALEISTRAAGVEKSSR